MQMLIYKALKALLLIANASSFHSLRQRLPIHLLPDALQVAATAQTFGAGYKAAFFTTLSAAGEGVPRASGYFGFLKGN